MQLDPCSSRRLPLVLAILLWILPGLPSTQEEPSTAAVVREPTYFIVASRTLRPGHSYGIFLHTFRMPEALQIRMSIMKEGVPIVSETRECHFPTLEVVRLKVPKSCKPGSYSLRLEGHLSKGVGGTAFVNETSLRYSAAHSHILIQIEKSVYRQGQTVRFRVFTLTTGLQPSGETFDVYLLDPFSRFIKRWLSKQSSLGAVSLEFRLADEPITGKWTIRVVEGSQTETKTFTVTRYYQNRFEVSVRLPEAVRRTEEFLRGSVMATYAHGGAVDGNVTFLATLRTNRKDFVFEEVLSSKDALPTSRVFKNVPEAGETYNLERGVHSFAFPLPKMLRDVEKANATVQNIKITAQVGDRFHHEVYEGFSVTRVMSSSPRLKVLGGAVRFFKPSMPFRCTVAIAYEDGTWVDHGDRHRLQLTPMVHLSTDYVLRLPSRVVKMSPVVGVWEVHLDLSLEIKNKSSLKLIRSLRLEMEYAEGVSTVLTAYSQQTSSYHQLQVTTSSRNPVVKQYVVFHVRANFVVDRFHFCIISKGVILQCGKEASRSSITTFAVIASPEMAPSATILVYHVDRRGTVVVDSMTFPVSHVFLGNVSLSLSRNRNENEKRDSLEILVRGDAGSYVGLSSADEEAGLGEDWSSSRILELFRRFDRSGLTAVAHSRKLPSVRRWETHYYPAWNTGSDASSTFEYSGLVVFTDASMETGSSSCAVGSSGQQRCPVGSCHGRSTRRCDGVRECADGSDEINCAHDRVMRTEEEPEDYLPGLRENFLERRFRETALWQATSIGRHGYVALRADAGASVPPGGEGGAAAVWKVFALGVRPLGHATRLVPPSGPLTVDVSVPEYCRLGEVVSVQVHVTLAAGPPWRGPTPLLLRVRSSSDYDSLSASGRKITGGHEHLVWLPQGTSRLVPFPVTPRRVGDVTVAVVYVAQTDSEVVERKLVVHAPGAPQSRHVALTLNLRSRGTVRRFLETNLTSTPIIPYRRKRLYLYGSNRARVSVSAEVVGLSFRDGPLGTMTLLGKPEEAADQLAFSMGVNLLLLEYLRASGQTQERAAALPSVLDRIGTLFQQMLRGQPGVRVTSFCLRVLAKAASRQWESSVSVDPRVLLSGLRWLLGQQADQGFFWEPLPLAGEPSSGDARKKVRVVQHAALTAHVLVALHDLADVAGNLRDELVAGRRRALGWFDRNLDVLVAEGSAYDLALVAYALALSRSIHADITFMFLCQHIREEGGFQYWGPEPVPLPGYRIAGQRSYLLPRRLHLHEGETVEATAYALLASVLRQEADLEPIVLWLNSQRLADGGWCSTQDTYAAIHALIEYSVRSRSPGDSASVDVTLEARAAPGRRRIYRFLENNASSVQSWMLEDAWGDVTVLANGSGRALLQLHVEYSVDNDLAQVSPPGSFFHLDVATRFLGRNASLARLRACTRSGGWTGEQQDASSGPAVLEVSVPSGYRAHRDRLDEYVRQNTARRLTLAVQRGPKLFFHFDKVERDPVCVEAALERWHPVANCSRYLPAKIYEYHAPEHHREILVEFLDLYFLTTCSVCGSYECARCPAFSSARDTPLSSLTAFILPVALALVTEGLPTFLPAATHSRPTR